MPIGLTTKEKLALLFIVCLIAVGLLLPHISQPEAYHHFADQRACLGIPHFFDVASNLIFTLAGAIGLCRLKSDAAEWTSARLPLGVFFVGLLLTGPGSAYYHWAPDSQTLLWDRLPMVIAFAGVIGAFLTQRISPRLGNLGLVTSFIVGGAGLVASVVTGNLALYLTLQFGGLLGLVAGLLLAKNLTDPLPWWTLIGWYAVAKVLELGDRFVWDFTHQWVSGHTLKHLAAGMAGVVVLRLFVRPRLSAPAASAL
jgi:hypothetical protein